MQLVRSKSSAPTQANEFSSPDGTPIVVNRKIGRGYVLRDDDVIVPMEGGGNVAVVNVADKGATLDGIDDDTGHVYDALNALPSNGGVLLIPGPCKTDPIVMPTTLANSLHGVEIQGLSARYSVLVPTGQNQALIAGQTTVTPTLATAPIRVRRLGFQSHPAGSTGAAIDMRRMSYSIVDDIEFFDNIAGRFAYGVLIDDESGAGHCYQNELSHIRVNNQTYGPVTVIKVSGTATTYKIRFLEIIGSMTCTGVNADTTTLFGKMEHCTIQGITGVGVYPGDWMTLDKCYFESMTTAIDGTGRTTMRVRGEDCYFNSAPLVACTSSTYRFTAKDSFSSASAIPRFTDQVQLTVANNGTAQFTPWNTEGNCLATIVDDNANAAIYQTRGGGHTTVEITDPQAIFTTAAGTGGSTNIYWSAGNARYEIQNNTGGQRIYTISFVTP